MQRTYGNRAGILKAWGRLNESLELVKKKEALCLELGSKGELQLAYGHQAVILMDWERLEEALALLKKQEVICLELGNRADLAHCYWNWGLLARAQRNSETEREKLGVALGLFTELNMPRERDAVAAELSKAQGAGTQVRRAVLS